MSKPDGFKRAERFRLAAAAVISAGLLVPLAAFGASGGGQSSSAAQYKITICHHTHSKKHPTVTIRISNKAWPAHQRHGDTLGACPAPSKPSKGHGHHATHGKSGSKGHGHGATHGKSDGKSQGNDANHGQSGSNGQSGSHGHGK